MVSRLAVHLQTQHLDPFNPCKLVSLAVTNPRPCSRNKPASIISFPRLYNHRRQVSTSSVISQISNSNHHLCRTNLQMARSLSRTTLVNSSHCNPSRQVLGNRKCNNSNHHLYHRYHNKHPHLRPLYHRRQVRRRPLGSELTQLRTSWYHNLQGGGRICLKPVSRQAIQLVQDFFTLTTCAAPQNPFGF